MSKQALAVKYRPKKFEDVVEQTVPKSILTEQLKNKTFKNCLLFCGGAGTGKAQPLYSKVLTPTGFITMGEVTVGTDVITGSGRTAMVIGVYPQGSRPIYEITLSNGHKFRVSDEHLNVVYEQVDNEFIEYVVITKDLLKRSRKDTYVRIVDSNLTGSVYYAIRNIKLIGEEDCQCIYVDAEEHTYITDGYVVTHNTTSARIFANEINDFKGHTIEIDAASHNGVDDARKIIEDARTQSLDSEYKVFVIDECHMISNAGWNALLKIVEEPPKKSVFLFCTTDPQKIPATILSRVQRYNFQKISQNGIVGRLKYIIEQENKEIEQEASGDTITYEDSAIEFIAKLADGGMRDSITLLDKAIGYSNNLTLSNVLEALGSVNYDTMFELTDALNKMNATKALETISEVYKSGLDLKQFIKQYSYFVLDLCKYKYLRSFDNLQMPTIYKDKLDSYNAEDFDFFCQLLDTILELSKALKDETVPKPLVESKLLLLCMEA